MFDWFPYRVTFARRGTLTRSARRPRLRLRRTPRRLAIASLLALGLNGFLALPAGAVTRVAGATGTVNATIPIAVVSIIVDPPAVTFGNCHDRNGASIPGGLVFPNGSCMTTPRTVSDIFGPRPIILTNGDTPSKIFVAATDPKGSPTGKPWRLCFVGLQSAQACTGSFGAPAADEAIVSIDTAVAGQVLFTTNRALSLGAATPTNLAAANTSHAIDFQMIGPASSTDASTTFRMSVTFTATL